MLNNAVYRRRLILSFDCEELPEKRHDLATPSVDDKGLVGETEHNDTNQIARDGSMFWDGRINK